MADTPTSADFTGDECTFEKPVKVVVASKGSKGEGGYVDQSLV